jgi:BRCT domain type II-containing protein
MLRSCFQRIVAMNFKPGSLTGQSVALTGKVLGMDRAEMNRWIVVAGGSASHQVDRNTTLLVSANGANATTTKFAKANRLGIPILSEQTFSDVIEGRMTLATAIANRAVGTASSPAPKQAQAQAAAAVKVSTREGRLREATVKQLDKLSTETSASPYGIGF